MRRGRGEEEAERHKQTGWPGPRRFQIKEQLIAFGSDCYIEDTSGDKVYHVDGKALRIRDTLILKDMQGRQLARIQEQKLRFKDAMRIDGPSGERLATIKKVLVTPVRSRWSVTIGAGRDLNVTGNIPDHDYQIGEGRHKVAEVSKRWFGGRDCYGVQIEPGQNESLILAMVLAIDVMAQ